MENTENSLYALIVGISQDVGEIKSDMKSVQEKVEQYNENSMKADERIMAKLEEYKVSSDESKTSLKKEIEDHEKRIASLENAGKNKLWAFFEKFKTAFIATFIAFLVAWCMKFASELVKSVKQTESQSVERTEGK